MAPVVIRTPTFSKASAVPSFKTPDIPFLAEKWTVTHSTLPMWKDKRNLSITYTPLEPSKSSISKENTDRIDDSVAYQDLEKTKINDIHGIDTAAGGDSRGEWNWRGTGWLKLITSHWEIIGWGYEEKTGNKWLITIFAKTTFTPAGIDVYSRDRTGLQSETLADIKAALAASEDEDVKKFAAELFEMIINDPSKKHSEQ